MRFSFIDDKISYILRVQQVESYVLLIELSKKNKQLLDAHEGHYPY